MPSFYAPQLYRQVLPIARIVSCRFGEFLADNIVRFTNLFTYLLTYLLSYMGMLSVCLSVRLSRPGTDSRPGEIETPGHHHMIA